MTNKLIQENESLKEQLNKENTEKHLANVKRLKAECEVESLKAQLKSLRNSTIDLCVKECMLPVLHKGDKIKLYGKETTVEGFSVVYNDGIGDYEIILHTTGRADPFKRSLDVIEILNALKTPD